MVNKKNRNKYIRYISLVLLFSIVLTSCVSLGDSHREEEVVVKDPKDEEIDKVDNNEIKENDEKTNEGGENSIVDNDEKEDLILGKYIEDQYYEMIERAIERYEIPEELLVGGERDDYIPELKKLSEYIPDVNYILEYIFDFEDVYLEYLLKYPQTLLFVLGTQNPEEYRESPIIREEEKNEDFIYLRQYDFRFGFGSLDGDSFATSGCGPTALSMVLINLLKDYSLTPNVVGEYAVDSGSYNKGLGSNWNLMTEGANHYGLTYEILPLSGESMVNALNEGKLIIINVSKGDFTYGGHYVVISGYEDGEFKVNDPNSNINTNRGWTFEELSPQIKNIWAYSK